MRRRSVGWLAAAGALLLALAPAASARECRSDLLRGLVVDGYVRAGEPFEIDYALERPDRVQDLVAVVDGVSYPLSPRPTAPVRVDAPQRTGRFEITFQWKKPPLSDAGVPECEGSVAYAAFAVPRRSRFGREGPRVDGVWRVRLMPRRVSAPPIRLRWRMRPECDYYGCTTVVTGRDERYRMLAWKGNYVDNVRFGSYCFGPDGRRVRGGYAVRLQHFFFVERDAWIGNTLASHAVRIDGETTVEYELTRTGRAAGCRAHTIVYTLRGVRVR